MSAFLKTIPSAPTPGYFTSFRTFVDSIPDAGKDRSSCHAHGENSGRIPRAALGGSVFYPSPFNLLEFS